jgi:hypothetical protein
MNRSNSICGIEGDAKERGGMVKLRDEPKEGGEIEIG